MDTVTEKYHISIQEAQAIKISLWGIESHCHLPKTTSDVGQLLSSTHKREKENARDMLMITLSSIRYLAQQGPALRGYDEVDSNFMQLLILRCEYNPHQKQRLDKSQKKYTSHENQREVDRY